MDYSQSCKVDLTQLESTYPEAYQRLDKALTSSERRFIWTMCKVNNAYNSSLYELVCKHFLDEYGLEVEADEGPGGYGWIIYDHVGGFTYPYVAPVTAQAAMLKVALKLAEHKIKSGR